MVAFIRSAVDELKKIDNEGRWAALVMVLFIALSIITVILGGCLPPSLALAPLKGRGFGSHPPSSPHLCEGPTPLNLICETGDTCIDHGDTAWCVRPSGTSALGNSP